jgi:hypothetical protein
VSTARGQANHALYLARILLAAWRRDLAAESVANVTLTQAYLPAVREHLALAYGWFLLEITRPGAVPETPPRGIAHLPGIEEGKAIPGEIREFQQLEQDGWIGDMLAASPARSAAPSPDNLAVVAPIAGPDQASLWADQLQSVFDRMGDSLDEY